MQEIFSNQKNSFRNSSIPNLKERKQNLKLILKIISDYKTEWIEAINEDFGHRSKDETLLMELMQAQDLIKFVSKNLRKWMRPKLRSSGLLNIPVRSKIFFQPLGVVGIISPWNYPIDLTLSPLVYAVATGNRVMIKPSEHTPKTSKLLQTLVSKYFDIEHVAVCCGDINVGIEFSKLPFDHLMFTGSTSTGKLVMAEAARNLTPVTLELGGKSPTIIGEEADIPSAARRICFGKSINSGQTCIAPDHIYIPKNKVDEFVKEYKKSFKKMYPNGEKDQGYTVYKDEADYLDRGFNCGEEYVYLMKIDTDKKDYLGRPRGEWFYAKSTYTDEGKEVIGGFEPLEKDAINDHIDMLKRHLQNMEKEAA